ncbi:MAG: hypothetical protein QOK24_2042, partial [Verrucomicrobiota bacterium]
LKPGSRERLCSWQFLLQKIIMKLYVGNLSFETTENDLQDLFETHGKVTDVALMMDRTTGRSRGFAFVSMADTTEANAAVAALNGKEVQGRTLTVNEARAREERPRQSAGNRY